MPTMRRNKPISIWLRTEAEAVLDARAVVTDNRSAVFDAILNRYEAVVQRSLPAIDGATLEWLTRVLPKAGFLGLREIALLPAAVEDHLAQSGEPDVHQVVPRLQAMSFAERLAIVDTLERRRGRP
jgi:hypothetical protein